MLCALFKILFKQIIYEDGSASFTENHWLQYHSFHTHHGFPFSQLDVTLLLRW